MPCHELGNSGCWLYAPQTQNRWLPNKKLRVRFSVPYHGIWINQCSFNISSYGWIVCGTPAITLQYILLHSTSSISYMKPSQCICHKGYLRGRFIPNMESRVVPQVSLNGYILHSGVWPTMPQFIIPANQGNRLSNNSCMVCSHKVLVRIAFALSTSISFCAGLGRNLAGNLRTLQELPPHRCPTKMAYILYYFSLLFGKKLFSVKH